MIISNIGTIVLSLPAAAIERSAGAGVQADTAHQVKLLSLANTVSRLGVGIVADFVSPVASYLPSGARTFPRKHRITRMAFLSLSSLTLVLTFLWMNNRVLTRDDIWALRWALCVVLLPPSLTRYLSVGTGIGYSAVFTVL